MLAARPSNWTTLLWGGAGFHKGHNPNAPEQKAKRKYQDAQKKDAKELWDQEGNMLHNHCHWRALLWAALFAKGSQFPGMLTA